MVIGRLLAALLALSVFTGVTVCLSAPAAAQGTEGSASLKIEWEDLVPDGDFPDPFKELTEKQREDVGYVSRVFYLLNEKKISPDSADVLQAKELVEALSQSGVDVPWLFTQRRHVAKMREIQANAVNADLAGKCVSLTGYVVPVKTSGNVITEFLLVPSYETCSHGTSLPPNQAILVTHENGIVSQGRVNFVKLRGQIEVTKGEHTRHTKFGIQKFDAAYSIKPNKVELVAFGTPLQRREKVQRSR